MSHKGESDSKQTECPNNEHSNFQSNTQRFLLLYVPFVPVSFLHFLLVLDNSTELRDGRFDNTAHTQATKGMTDRRKCMGSLRMDDVEEVERDFQ